MVKGHTYSEQLFESEAFRHFINTFLNKESGITKGCEITQTSNTIEIGKGFFVILGGLLEESTGTSMSVPAEAGYYRLVYEIDLSKVNTEAEFNQGSYKFVKGVGAYSNLTQEDLDNDGNVYQFEFCQFRITEAGIQDFIDKRTFLNFDSIYEEIRKKIEEVEDGSAYVLKSNINIVTATPSSPMTATEVLTKFPLSKITSQLGEKLTLENGGIKIGSGITHVLISAQTVTPYPSDKTMNFAVYKNEVQVARSVLSTNQNSSVQNSFNISTKLIEVEEGDILYLYCLGDGIIFNSEENLTYLTVESVGY